VTTFELFFDLMFVFAFTQVTQLMAHAHSAMGVLQALIILIVLWWSWCSYSWLANQTHVDEGVVRIGMSVAMIAMFVVALVIPEAFDDLEGGLSGPIVFVIALFVLRLIHLGLYLFAAGEDVGLRRQVLSQFAPTIASCGLLLAGAIIGGPAQVWWWLGGVIVDVALTWITANGGNWRLYSPAHWSERYGLVVILALGESIVAIGVGAAHLPISVPVLIGSVLAILLSLSLWWLYFDVVAIAAEHELAKRDGKRRVDLARDGYTYLHFPLIAGIVISALGVEEVIAHAVDTAPLGLFGAAALFGGTSLYLAGHAFFWRRVGGTWKAWRLVGGTALLALLPIGALLQPLIALGLAVAVAIAAALGESVMNAQHRAEVRAGRSEG